MDICFEGVGQVAATFKVDGTKAVRPGMAVVLTAGGTVGLGAAGSLPCGVLLGNVRGGAAAVQIGGVAKVAYSGTAPAVGWQELACDGEGGVTTVAGAVDESVVESNGESNGEGGGVSAVSGLKCLVLAVDEDGKTAVIKL